MEARDLPIIDVEALGASAGEIARLEAACREWGAFRLVRHGIPESLIEAFTAQGRAFFALPHAEKSAVSRSETNPWGFFDRELTKNTVDWKEIFDFGPAATEGPFAGAEPRWPRALPGFRRLVTLYYRACETLGLRLLAAISSSLGMRADHLAPAFRPEHTSFLRLNHYPTCARPTAPDAVEVPTAGHLALNHHTDAGALTLLLQDAQPGLQIWRGGRWHLVAPKAGSIVVNLGDIVQVWSNDRYEAPLHRVTASRHTTRFSAPFFLNPAYTTRYAPLPSTCDAQNPPRYRPIHWGRFRAERAAGDYRDRGEEIQISHFRCARDAGASSSA
jgi:isopenicillin N synthase-like dioxygenase